jgi:CubicO group peptidase (beta-lactamase class C family)
MRPAFVVIAAALVAGFQSLSAQLPAPDWARAVDSMVAREMKSTLTPGAQIAIVAHGRLVYTKGYGVADAETGRMVTAQTLFQSGSVAKLVTGTLLAQLAADGVIDLKAPISRYVPELDGRRVGMVTVHQLLTHSAGWREGGVPFGRLEEAALGETFRAVTDTMMVFEPGRIPSYSNPSFSMAGYVAERATRKGYTELVDSILFRKLGITRATWKPTVAMTHDFSQGHTGPPAGPPRVQRPMPANAADNPSAFLWATSADWSRLAAAMVNGGMLDRTRVLTADAVRSVTTRQVPFPGEQFLGYGYGLETDSLGGHRMWQQIGATPGFSALVTMWPSSQLAIIVQANRYTTLPERVTRLAAQIVGGLTIPAHSYDLRDPTDAERAALVGTYRLENGSVVVSDAGGRLEIRVGQRTLPTRMTRDGTRLVAQAPFDSLAHPYVIVRDAGGTIRFLFRDNARTYAKQP